MSTEASFSERLLTFEVEGGRYALPIRGVLEVVESARLSSVPTLARERCAVMNWHGDALPVISAEVLLAEVSDAEFDTSEEPGAAESVLERQQVLVISDRDQAAKLGLPVDAVFGLIDGETPRGPRADLVSERRSIEGRVVSVLDPRGLVGRAEVVIAEMVT